MPESLDASRSSWIVGAEWDEETLEMTVDLGVSGRFEYVGVPREVWDAWRVASSLGEFYRRRIRGRYA